MGLGLLLSDGVVIIVPFRNPEMHRLFRRVPYVKKNTHIERESPSRLLCIF
jgi:hypothetical protein